MSDDFLRRLRELDETLAGRPIPARVQTQTLERLREAHAGRSARPWVRRGLVLGFAAGAAGTWLLLRTPAPVDPGPARAAIATPVAPAAATITIAASTLTALPCEPSREADVVALPAACRLSGADMQVSTLGPARLSDVGGRLRVVSGDVIFAVAPRERARPLTIDVSGGVIEIVGTRFLIHEEGARGHVELYEGRLRFVGAGGDVRFIEPGQRHAWRGDVASSVAPPEEAVPPEEVAPPEEAPPRRPAPRSAAEAQEITRRVTAQRHRGAHAEAARELAEALRAGRWPRATAEVWSYELGTLYADELDDRAAACAHWRVHLRRFGDGPYAASVRASVQQLGCER